MARSTQELKIPLLMRISVWLALLYTLWAASLIVLAIVNDGVFIGQNIAWDSVLWLQLLGPLYLIKIFFMSVIAYAFYKQKSWSRHLVIALWIIVTAYALIISSKADFIRDQMRPEIIQAIVLGIVSGWYFYMKKSVARYFKALQE